MWSRFAEAPRCRSQRGGALRGAAAQAVEKDGDGALVVFGRLPGYRLGGQPFGWW
jgi:hypothetical protein